MKFLDLFSGISGFRNALESLGHESYGWVEIDKFARKSYEAMYDTEGEWTREDITAVTDEEWRDLRGEVNLVVGGSPCVAFSLAGRQLGFEDTRGTLFFDYARAVKEIQPEYFLYENVKGLLGNDKGRTVRTMLKTFDGVGYAVDFDIFNTKFYGVPQNRERIYIMGKRKDLIKEDTYVSKLKGKPTKAIDKLTAWAEENVTMANLLPPTEGLEVTTRLKDILEENVDEKYYMKEEQTSQLIKNLKERIELGKEPSENDLDMVGMLNMKGDESIRRVYNPEGLSSTLTTMQEGSRQPKIVEGLPIREATKKGYTLAEEGDSVNILYPNSKTRRGRVGKQMANTLQAATDATQGVVERTTVIDDTQGFDGIRTYEDIAPTIRSSRSGLKIIEPVVAASRGRNPDNPSDRTTGAPTEQRLEINEDGVSNTLTTVQKDNYVLEPTYRIRKLSPLECWRLQGFPDADFYKAQEVNSNTQLYKQAGNAVSVPVVKAIAEYAFGGDNIGK